jgi:hypothetical protein
MLSVDLFFVNAFWAYNSFDRQGVNMLYISFSKSFEKAHERDLITTTFKRPGNNTFGKPLEEEMYLVCHI